MQLVHIDEPSIMLLLDENSNIVHAWRVRRHQRLPLCVVPVLRLRASASEAPKFGENYFQTDGLGCTRLAHWILTEHPDRSLRASRTRFYRLFSNDPIDAVTAQSRILNGQESRAQGETSFYIGQQWAHHPTEMAAIKALGQMYRQRLMPIPVGERPTH